LAYVVFHNGVFWGAITAVARLVISLEDLGIEAGFGNELFHTGCLKSFADGGLGASTAWLTAPYSDNPANYGTASDTMQHPEEMYAEFKRADQAGLQLITHAIGDRGNHAILDFTSASRKQMVRAIGVIASSMHRHCCQETFPASPSFTSLPRSSRSTRSTTAVGQRSGLGRNASRPRMHFAL
jgi:hypothetical protein